jgi:uncharacterized membrane protein
MTRMDGAGMRWKLKSATLVPLVMACGAVGPLSGAAAQCQYEAVLIHPPADPLGGSPTGTAINEQGHICGEDDVGISGYTDAFICIDGETMVILDRPSWMNTAAPADIADVGGLNDQGLIVGTANVDDGGFRAFIHDGVSYGILPVVQDFSHTYGEAVNDDLIVAGWSNQLDTLLAAAVTWQNGKIIPIEGIPGRESQAVDINNNGVILGWTGDWSFYDADVFIADENGITIIGKPPGTYSTKPEAINDLGDITGYAYYPIADHPGFIRRGFLWSQGQWTDLGSFPPELDESFPRDINNSRQIVGVLEGPGPGKGFMWDNGTLHIINDLLVAGSEVNVIAAHGINDAGQITGTGYDPDGGALILTPVVPQGDLTLDCIVGPADLAQLLAQWGQCPAWSKCTADIAPAGGDGTVGPMDLAALLANWS